MPTWDVSFRSFLGPLGFEGAQHRQTLRLSVVGVRSKALHPFGLPKSEPEPDGSGSDVESPSRSSIGNRRPLTHPERDHSCRPSWLIPAYLQWYLAHKKPPTPLGPP